jgi:hypothetical protein
MIVKINFVLKAIVVKLIFKYFYMMINNQGDFIWKLQPIKIVVDPKKITPD